MTSAHDAGIAAGNDGSFLPDAQPPDAGDTSHQLPFPTVALGASAGGVEALQRLFAAMPPDLGCAFVVLMHLAPAAKSQLPALPRPTLIPRSPRPPGCARRWC